MTDTSDLVERLQKPLPASMFLKPSALIASLIAEREEAATALTALRDSLKAWSSRYQHISEVEKLAEARAETAERERDELQQVFDSRWTADQRAIKAWQAAHPDRSSTWPDHADMVVWLLGALDEARAALKPFAKAASDYDNRFGDDEPTWGDYGLNLGHLRAARAVIKQGE